MQQLSMQCVMIIREKREEKYIGEDLAKERETSVYTKDEQSAIGLKNHTGKFVEAVAKKCYGIEI